MMVRVTLRYADGGVLETDDDAAKLGTLVKCNEKLFTFLSFGRGIATYLEFVGEPHVLRCEKSERVS